MRRTGTDERKIFLRSMHGMGDNVHQRAIVRTLLNEGREVWIDTPWPGLYCDFLESGKLAFIKPRSHLRTQSKNSDRERFMYMRNGAFPPVEAVEIRPHYDPSAVRRLGSVLLAMLESVNSVVHSGTDFRFYGEISPDHELELDSTWFERFVFYRPLVERTEWGGCSARNPSHLAYKTLFQPIMEDFNIVSVADIDPPRECIVGHTDPAACDTVRLFHRGELSLRNIMALMSRARFVYCSPGFAVPLAQAFGTPVICIFGGYESGRSFSTGAPFAPYLPIDTITPCECFSHSHKCEKRIDVESARIKIDSFIETMRLRQQSTITRQDRFSNSAPVYSQPGIVTDGPIEHVSIDPVPFDWGEVPPSLHNKFLYPHEVSALIALFRQFQIDTIIEIGANSGRTAHVLLKNLPKVRKYIGIEVPPNYSMPNATQRNEVPQNPGQYAFSDKRFILWTCGRGTFDLIASDLSAGKNMGRIGIFVDGDHTLKGVANDTEIAIPLAQWSGGMIIWHDYHSLGTVGVREFLDEYATIRSTQPCNHVEGTWLVFQSFPGQK